MFGAASTYGTLSDHQWNGSLGMPQASDLFEYAHSDRASILYIVTNLINGKQYVGISRETLAHRKRRHANDATHGKKTRLHCAIRKYGLENLQFEQIAEFATFKEACAAERAKIAEIKPAYNVTAGGEGSIGFKHSPESLEKMRVASTGRPGYWLGKKRSLEDREKMSLAKLANPQKVWLGKSRDQSTKDKISSTKKGCAPPPVTPLMEKARAENMRKAAKLRCKPVICLDDGKIYESAAAASLAYGFCPTTVAGVCNPKSKGNSAYGLRFKYLSPEEEAA